MDQFVTFITICPVCTESSVMRLTDKDRYCCKRCGSECPGAALRERFKRSEDEKRRVEPALDPEAANWPSAENLLRLRSVQLEARIAAVESTLASLKRGMQLWSTS